MSGFCVYLFVLIDLCRLSSETGLGTHGSRRLTYQQPGRFSPGDPGSLTFFDRVETVNFGATDSVVSRIKVFGITVVCERRCMERSVYPFVR